MAYYNISLVQFEEDSNHAGDKPANTTVHNIRVGSVIKGVKVETNANIIIQPMPTRYQFYCKPDRQKRIKASRNVIICKHPNGVGYFVICNSIESFLQALAESEGK